MNTKNGSAENHFPMRLVLCLTTFAFALRAMLLLAGPWNAPERAVKEDSPRILLLAHNLNEYGTYGKSKEDGLVHLNVERLRAENGTLPSADANGLRPEAFRPPGYPFVLAAFESLGLAFRWELLFQCILGASLTFMTARIASALGLSCRGVGIAAFLWAVHPALVLYDTIVLTESLFNFFCVSSIYVVACFPGRWTTALGGGLLLGFAGLIRPLGLLYLPFAFAPAIRRKQFSWTAALLQILLCMIPSAAWALRNQSVGDGLRVTTVPEINLYYYTASYSISEERGEDWFKAWPQRTEELSDQLQKQLAPGEDVYAAMSRRAIQEIRNRPGASLRVQTKSSLKLFVDHSLGPWYDLIGERYVSSGLFSHLVLGNTDQSNSGSIGGAIAAGCWSGGNALISLAALAGLIRGWRSHRYALILGTGLTILLFTLATGSVGVERMRLPMMLPLFLLAAFALGGPSRVPQ